MRPGNSAYKCIPDAGRGTQMARSYKVGGGTWENGEYKQCFDDGLVALTYLIAGRGPTCDYCTGS